MVTQDQVIAAAGHDRVRAGAAEQHVLAVAGRDRVVAAERRVRGRDRSSRRCRRGRCRRRRCSAPSPATIASAPEPPMSTSSAPCAVIVSLPPTHASTLWMRLTGVARPSVVSPRPPLPKTLAPATTRPRSPKRMSPPLPPKSLSLPWPPKTISAERRVLAVDGVVVGRERRLRRAERLRREGHDGRARRARHRHPPPSRCPCSHPCPGWKPRCRSRLR